MQLQNAQENLPNNAQLSKNGRRLVILSTNDQNRGLYTCLVRNQIGEISQDFPLDVIGWSFEEIVLRNLKI
jgi:hypothetical protein